MFTIEGIYAVRFYPNGSISRDKRAFKMTLNTEDGVMAFLDEQRPFLEVKITNAETKEDLTTYFLGE